MSNTWPAHVAVGQLHAAISAEAAIPFGAVSEAVGASYTLLFAERAIDGGVENTVVEGVDQAYCQRLRHAAAEQLLPTWLHELDSGVVIDRAALQRDHDFAHSDFYNYVVRPEGRFHCLITTPYITPTHRYHLIVGRPIKQADFTAVDVRILRALLPYIASLIAIETNVVRARESTGDLLAVFDQISQNVFLVSPVGELLFANAGARRILQLRDGVVSVNNRLGTATPALNFELQQAIARVTATNGVTEVALELARPSGCPAFQVTVLRIDGAHELDGTSSTRAMLVVRRPEDETLIDGGSLGRTYGLTAKELELAVLLARGQNLRDAACTLGMRYNTARCHLRHTFEKTDTHHQGDLIRMVLNASRGLRR